MTRTPVLLIAFNRPDNARQVLETIRAAGVGRLYVTLDGPRAGHPTDATRCAEVLDLVRSQEWAPTVLVREHEANLGCKDAVVDGLDWFFGAEPEGIVLEDDCLPAPDFFGFCDAMLERYRDDDRVWLVSGSNYLGSWRPGRSDWFFGDGNTWGWATYGTAWRQRDMEMLTWHDQQARARARHFLGWLGWLNLRPYYESCAPGRVVDTWDYQWSWTRASQEKLAVLPARNLVSNIGYGPDATHTVGDDGMSALPTGSLDLGVLRAPPAVAFDRGYQSVLVGRHEAVSRTRSAGARVLRRLGLLSRPPRYPAAGAAPGTAAADSGSADGAAAQPGLDVRPQ